MSRMLTSIIMIGSLGYFAYRFRYRIINTLLSSGWLRRIAVSSMMSLPGIKRRMMQSVFGGPSEW
ncbi:MULTISPECIES: hypothetical protein [Neobacillus]|uniref:Na+/H+ antiporter n=1 Tax=Neobacillus citreus TaxID=2833578 RepID=A0A942YAV0_9BACI|nr:hypothetical protein [Neobacillus citreus]MCH6266622.1 hypothetical protein [Neobacillus citreus]